MSHDITALVSWMDLSFVSKKIRLYEFEDSGRGLQAVETIQASELILSIPHSLLFNAHTVIKHISQHNKAISLPKNYSDIHIPEGAKSEDEILEVYALFTLAELWALSSFQLMSLFICLEKNRDSYWAPFLDVLPPMDTFEYMPLVWQVLKVEGYQTFLENLPDSSKLHAGKVYQKYMKDRKVVKELLASKIKDEHLVDIYLKEELYLWAWVNINSRCLYMELKESKDSSDNFTMAPYVDFINHVDEDHCRIKVDTKGFHVFTTSKYQPGDQLYLSYGPHSNSFLLCEYGFTLPLNKWNDIDISPQVLELLSPAQKDFLKENSYYGDYTISRTFSVSYRTEIALAVAQERDPQLSRKLKAYIQGVNDGEAYKGNSSRALHAILTELGEKLEKQKSNTSSSVVIKLHDDIQEIIDLTIQ